MVNKNKTKIMQKNNIKILFLILLSLFISVSTVKAAGDSLFVSPATSTVNVGSIINASVVAGTSGDKICAVQGTVIFNNLTCQSITLASGTMAQTQPTCSNPTFVIGIPNCVTTNTTLFTVSAKATTIGTASVSFSGVNLVGFGSSVGNASMAGNYTVNALPVVQQQITPVQQPKVTKTTTPKTEQKTTSETIVATPETNANQTAAIGTTPGAYLFFGWIWNNIIWIIVLIIASAVSYVAGRMSCKRK